MTASNLTTTADLLEALDRHPEFRSKARRLLLTDELLQLPVRQEEFNEAQRVTNLRFERALGDLLQATQRNSDNVDKLIQEIRRINNSIGELKGNVARRALNWHFGYIAEDMGYRLVNSVTRNERWEMAHRQDISDIPVGQRRSFYEADLLMEVADTEGATHYIAVEASYTADTRDTERAMRNAEFLKRFTGCPAHAAVASRQNDYTIRQLIEDKVLFWYQLTDEDFTPD